MHYKPSEQKRILFEMEKDLLDLVTIDIATGYFEVIYTLRKNVQCEDAFFRKDFFDVWRNSGIWRIYEPDKERMLHEISRDYLLEKLAENDTYSTLCRYVIEGEPKYCKINVAKDLIKPGELIMSSRNVDMEVRSHIEYRANIDELYRRESIYREAILANAAGYMEVNLTKNQITSKIHDYRDELIQKDLDMFFLGNPIPYDAFEIWWADNMLLSDKDSFLSFSNCRHLINCYENNESIVSIECEAKTFSGNVNTCIERYYISKDTLSGDIIAICVLYDLSNKEKTERAMKELKDKLQLMRINNFTSQMHPHFLYNSLSSIREIILTDPKYASDLLYDFTTFLRSTICAMSNDSMITFSQEFENIKAYVNIEKMRFGNRLNMIYDIAVSDFMIIPLSIQPIVENAIKHGIFEKGEADGTVTLKTREMGSCWEISVIDDGIGFDQDEIKRQIEAGEKDSTGLYNLIFRLENIMNASVEIQSELGMGTTVQIHIPKGKNNA